MKKIMTPLGRTNERSVNTTYVAVHGSKNTGQLVMKIVLFNTIIEVSSNPLYWLLSCTRGY